MNRTRVVLAVFGALIFVNIVVVIVLLINPPLNPEPVLLEDHMCTLLDCAEGLFVHLAGDIPETYTVAAMWEDGARSIECSADFAESDGSMCLPDEFIFIEGAVSEEITITIFWEGGSATETFWPTYSISRPNGPNCDPECRVGSVTLTLQ